MLCASTRSVPELRFPFGEPVGDIRITCWALRCSSGSRTTVMRHLRSARRRGLLQLSDDRVQRCRHSATRAGSIASATSKYGRSKTADVVERRICFFGGGNRPQNSLRRPARPFWGPKGAQGGPREPYEGGTREKASERKQSRWNQGDQAKPDINNSEPHQSKRAVVRAEIDHSTKNNSLFRPHSVGRVNQGTIPPILLRSLSGTSTRCQYCNYRQLTRTDGQLLASSGPRE
jgi:hypothetical protein